MGLFSCCSVIDRCCCCKGSLKVGVLFIVFLSMLAGCYALSMCLWPSCQDIFCPDSGGLVDELNIVKWTFFTLTVLLLVSCFVFFLAIYLQNFPHRSIPADLHVVISFCWSFLAVAFAVLQVLQFMDAEITCNNPSDFITVLLFAPCMLYFTCVINSYITKADDMK